MKNIFSKNKYTNLIINILLFLVGINFLHYGQLILPIICFILFIDNRLQFKVNNPITFIILCLFAISFYAFSYPLGFYSVMGFTLPMAYYIGSNIKDINPNKVKNIIYLLSIAMGLHIILNMIYEINIRGLSKLINSSKHFDIWTKDKMSTTITAIDFVLLASSIYYILINEKNKTVKYISCIIFFFDLLFCLITGRRTSLLLLMVCVLFSFIYDNYYLKRNKNIKKTLRYLLYVLLIVFIVALILYFDIGGIYSLFDGFYILEKLKQGFDSNRIKIFISALKLAPSHLWGKQEISNILGIQIHDLYSDVYDYAGIISWLLLIVYSLMLLRNVIKLHLMKEKHNILFMSIFLAIFIQMSLEAMMSGASLFVIVTIIITTMYEGLVINGKK